MDLGSFAIGVLVGGIAFGTLGLLIGIALGSMASKMRPPKKLKPQADGSVEFN